MNRSPFVGKGGAHADNVQLFDDGSGTIPSADQANPAGADHVPAKAADRQIILNLIDGTPPTQDALDAMAHSSGARSVQVRGHSGVAAALGDTVILKWVENGNATIILTGMGVSSDELLRVAEGLRG